MNPPDRASADAALPRVVLDMARAVRQAGGRAFLVGGWVRDLLAVDFGGARAASPPDEYDLEVYGLPPEDLRRILEGFGRVNLVGESFAVYKVSPVGASNTRQPTVDVSLPGGDPRSLGRAGGPRGTPAAGGRSGHLRRR
jgi:hypothetical protein